MKMHYSRRELYAAGEPIGDSATYRKADGGLILGDGGGGGGNSPVQQQTQISDLPEWAKGYAQDVLAKGKALTAQTYQPYTAQRIAGFNPLQEQAFQGAANLGPTAQTAAASNIAGAAGLGALGQNYQAGRFQGGTFTPRAAQQYMNPYVQSSLAPQLALMQQQQGQQAAQMAGQATQAGAFGGSRFGLAQAQQNLNNQLAQQNLVGQGYNTAYQQAQQQFNTDAARRLQAQQLGEQSRQFGANLGLQGLSTGLQAASTLGGLGQQQFAQQQGAMQAQSAAGAQQQAQQQKSLDMAYQDYLTQMNYPYQQLSYMSNLIRGTPMGMNTQSQVFQSPGSLTGQVAGLGIGALGMANLAKGAGMYAEGGEVQSYADGGGVDSAGNVDDIVKGLSDTQLAQAEQAAQSRGDYQQLQAILSEKAIRASERRGLASAYNQMPYSQQEAMANGGIVAFSGEDESQVKDSSYGEQMGKVWDFLSGLPVQAAKSITGYSRLSTTEAPAEKTTPASSPFSATSANLMNRDQAEALASRVAETTPKKEEEKTPTQSIAKHPIAQQVIQAGKSMGVPEQDTRSMIKSLMDEMEAKNKPLEEEASKLTEAQKGRAEKIRQNALGQALAQFGFGWAQQAAQPGARFMGSAAKASPIIGQVAAEQDKLAQAAEDNYSNLRLNELRYQQSVRKGDMQTALQYANLINQDKKSQQLIELERQKLGIMAQHYGQAGVSSIGKVVNELSQKDPEFAKLPGQKQFEIASKIAGYSFRTDAAMGSKLQTALNKIEEDYKMLPILKANAADNPMVQQMEAERNRRIAQARALYPSVEDTQTAATPGVTIPKGVTIEKLGG